MIHAVGEIVSYSNLDTAPNFDKETGIRCVTSYADGARYTPLSSMPLWKRPNLAVSAFVASSKQLTGPFVKKNPNMPAYAWGISNSCTEGLQTLGGLRMAKTAKFCFLMHNFALCIGTSQACSKEQGLRALSCGCTSQMIHVEAKEKQERVLQALAMTIRLLHCTLPSKDSDWSRWW